MKTIITSKLMRRCLILAVMILGLVYVASSDRYAQPVAAAPCCENCPGGGDPGEVQQICGGRCWYYPSNTPEWDACFNECVNFAMDCHYRCVYCYSNGPGGDCNSAADCPVGYHCSADNICTQY